MRAGKAVHCYSLCAAKVKGASEVPNTCQATGPAAVPLTTLALAQWLQGCTCLLLERLLVHFSSVLPT